MEGKFCDGRTDTVCDSVEGRGEHGFPVPRIGISCKTGYKIFERYEECGLEGLTDVAGAPARLLPLASDDGCLQLRLASCGRAKPIWQSGTAEGAIGIASPDRPHLAIDHFSIDRNAWMIENF